jgi:hypothetical protein
MSFKASSSTSKQSYVESLFYQVKATDADMIALPACAILLTALVATLPAVLRALRTDPT